MRKKPSASAAPGTPQSCSERGAGTALADRYCHNCGADLAAALASATSRPPKQRGIKTRWTVIGPITAAIVILAAMAARGDDLDLRPANGLRGTHGVAPIPALTFAMCRDADTIASNAQRIEDEDPLNGRLGGTRTSFTARFGPPSEEDAMFLTWHLEGCGTAYVTVTEGHVSRISVYPFRISLYPARFEGADAWWTLGEAHRIAARLLPRDVEMDTPHRSISVVGHECSSEALRRNVPMGVDADSDTNRVPGRCSVVYQVDADDRVRSIVVQLQSADPH